MANEPDPRRLKALEDRIAKVKKADKPRADRGKGFSQGEVAWRMVIELVSGLLIGFAIGFGLDTLFGTLPILLVLFTLIGFAAGVKTMLGTARELAERQTVEPAAKAADTNKAAVTVKDEGE